ncbi:YczE/YyaS/YitT family protein [Microbispora sp. CA-135349]|uniref:membrane protein YczE n=1 Tax=Microbispora sp. CA-135349 TaxID=3239953 RepID=UPI003D93911F
MTELPSPPPPLAPASPSPTPARSRFSLPRPRSLALRLVRLYAGLVLYGAGIALLVRSGLGLDPWEVFHQGMSVRTGWSIGLCINLVGALVLLLWIPLRQRPGLGTISNVLVVGTSADGVMALVPAPAAWPVQWAFLLSGIVAIAAASGLYIHAGFGPGPRDGLMTGLNRLGLSIRLARTVVEIGVLAVGWLLGGTVGIGTVVFALAIGPVTQVFMKLWAPAGDTARPPGTKPS